MKLKRTRYFIIQMPNKYRTLLKEKYLPTGRTEYYGYHQKFKMWVPLKSIVTEEADLMIEINRKIAKDWLKEAQK